MYELNARVFAFGTKNIITPFSAKTLDTSKSSFFSFFKTSPAGRLSPISIGFSFVAVVSSEGPASEASVSTLALFSTGAFFSAAGRFFVAGYFKNHESKEIL